MQQLFVEASTLKGLFWRLDLGQDDPESGDLMSGNSVGVMPGKDFISVHQVHFDNAVMGTGQMRFRCNPVQECLGHQKSVTVSAWKQSEGVCRC